MLEKQKLLLAIIFKIEVDMKVMISCSECAQSSNFSPNIISSDLINDEGHYFHVCKNGHKSVQISQSMKFEDLFENGANAIIDGYYREGVLSFAASLERFYEYFIRVILSSKIDNPEKIEEAWKEIKNQSERQLGAFIINYTMSFDVKPDVLKGKQVELRNKVAHKGYIPKIEETIEYGQCVMNLIIPDLIKLKDGFEEQVKKSILDKVTRGKEYFEKMKSEHGDDIEYVTSAPNNTLSIINYDLKIIDLTQRIEEISEVRDKLNNL